jgi:molybdopterin converting factor small subunit
VHARFFAGSFEAALGLCAGAAAASAAWAVWLGRARRGRSDDPSADVPLGPDGGIGVPIGIASPDPGRDPAPVPSLEPASDETVELRSAEPVRATLTPWPDEGGADAGGPSFELCGDRHVVGRNRDFADLRLEERTVGRMHADLERRGEAWFVRDRGSVNGTVVNGTRLGEGEEAELRDGDRVAFADRAFEFRIRSRG